MERTTIEEARLIFGNNFLGPEEIATFVNRILSNTGQSLTTIPEIPYNKDLLEKLAENYILVLGIPSYGDFIITIRNLRNVFGMNPELSQPCFYNQDWYDKEEFIDMPLPLGWYLIRKNPSDNTRGLDPNTLCEKEINFFPPAILCTFVFFAYWIARRNILWEYDFVWCCDKDHNGDRIYVGKYTDIDGSNKSGFSIHRHLSLRPCYTAIDFIYSQR